MNTNPLLRTTLNYGALSGIASFIVFLAIYFKGMNPLGSVSWIGAWIPIVFICLSTKFYRDHYLSGFMTYGQAMKTGLLTALAASFLFVLLIYIFATVIDASIIEQYKNEMRSGMEETKFMFSREMFEQGMESIEKLTMATISYNDFFMKMIGALLVSLITAAVYRKQPAEFEE